MNFIVLMQRVCTSFILFQIRIEDDVIIKKDGVECMTQVPRTIEEIEKLMSST